MKIKRTSFAPTKIAVAISMATAMTASGNLYAQSEISQVKASKRIANMEEVVVTARKREESLQEAPVAITVMSPEAIKNAGVSNMNDIGARLPNLSTIDEPAGLNGNGFAPEIRGMRSASRQIGEESGLGVFIDGAYAGSNDAGNKFLPPIQRVEFLPGPQATLFGKNTTLGVLNVVTKKPGEQFEGEVKSGVGNNGHAELSATVMGPVSDSLSLGLTVGTREYSGYKTNYNRTPVTNDDGSLPSAPQYTGQLDGVQGPEMKSVGAAFQLAWRGDNNRLDVMVDHNNNERTNQMPAELIEGFGALPLDTANSSDPGEQTVEETGINIAYNHDLGAGTLTSITNYREFSADQKMDDDSTPFQIVYIDKWLTEQEQVSQELRWAQEVGPVSYLAGVYYQDQSLDMSRGAILFGDTVLDDYILLDGRLENNTVAAFVNGDMDLSEDWGLELGLRYGSEKKEMPLYQQSGALGLGLWNGTLDGSRSTDNLSYTAALTFAATDSLNTHFRYSRGYKSGGFSIEYVTSSNPPPGYEFDDEQADSFELGAKWQISDSLWLNTVAFYTDYSDLQVNQLLSTPQGTPYFSMGNAGKARTEGIETVLVYTGEQLTLNASVGYNDAYYTEWMRPADDSGTNFEDMKGYEMPSPRFTSNILASYDLGDLTLTGEYMFRKGTPPGPGEPSNLIGDDVWQVNLRGSYAVTENISATLWVKNLTDERAVTSRGTNTQAGFLAMGAGWLYPDNYANAGDMVTGNVQAPRHFGLDVEYTF